MELFLLIFAFSTVCAIAALEWRDLLAAALALGASGFFVGILFVLWMAPDLALVQFLVGTLMTAVLVVAIARTHRRSTEPETRRTTPLLGTLLAFSFVLFLVVIPTMTPFGHPNFSPKVYGHYTENGIHETESKNLVTSVVLDYRGYDTLGEVVVLFTTVLGISVVLRKLPERRGVECQ